MDIVDRLLRMSGPNKPNVCSEAADEIISLRSRPCPYVTGTATQHCTLTPFTLTDAEREAVAWASKLYADWGPEWSDRAVAMRGLLERMK